MFIYFKFCKLIGLLSTKLQGNLEFCCLKINLDNFVTFNKPNRIINDFEIQNL